MLIVWLIWGDAGVITLYHCCVMMERSAPRTLAFMLSLVSIFIHFCPDFVLFNLFSPVSECPHKNTNNLPEEQTRQKRLWSWTPATSQQPSLRTVGTLLSLSRAVCCQELQVNMVTERQNYEEIGKWNIFCFFTRASLIFLIFVGSRKCWLGACGISHLPSSHILLTLSPGPGGDTAYCSPGARGCYTWPHVTCINRSNASSCNWQYNLNILQQPRHICNIFQVSCAKLRWSVSFERRPADVVVFAVWNL